MNIYTCTWFDRSGIKHVMNMVAPSQKDCFTRILEIEQAIPRAVVIKPCVY